MKFRLELEGNDEDLKDEVEAESIDLAEEKFRNRHILELEFVSSEELKANITKGI